MPNNLNNLKSNYSVSQNELYGHTQLMDHTGEKNHDTLYKKMKNKINYGGHGKSLNNNGKRKMVK